MQDIIFSLINLIISIIALVVSFSVAILFFEHKVKFKELHIKRARVIEELWSKINDVHEQLIDDKQEENIQRRDGKRYLGVGFINKLYELRTYFNKNSIYFSDKMTEQFNSIFQKLQEKDSARIEVADLTRDLEAMKKPLEKEFRKLLGV